VLGTQVRALDTGIFGERLAVARRLRPQSPIFNLESQVDWVADFKSQAGALLGLAVPGQQFRAVSTERIIYGLATRRAPGACRAPFVFRVQEDASSTPCLHRLDHTAGEARMLAVSCSRWTEFGGLRFGVAPSQAARTTTHAGRALTEPTSERK